ncbi:MAG: sensor domain-containing diguanylate cyclase [Nitrospiraceae bacterium]|nr:sensor domain-containing diguanylate cyclase [Nitrospiraceae bacterium]
MAQDDSFYKTLLDNLHDGVYFVDRNRTITYWNKGAERITGYKTAEVVGKSCSDNILVHVDKDGHSLCTTICPLKNVMNDGRERNEELFLHHKDGHRVPITIRVVPIYDDQGEMIGGVETFTDNTPPAVALERLAELERLAYVDALTGLANRRYAEITLNARIEELQRYGWHFGVLFIDIDRFKDINDKYGHDLGDEVLKIVARTLQNSVRSFDVVCRWGGEEYVAVIANVEGDELVAMANRCRLLVEQSDIPAIQGLRVTISIGAAVASSDDTVDSIIRRVDMLMYRSKEAGRNRVTVAQ